MINMNKLKVIQKVISFEKVTGNSKQIICLYDLLKARKYNISHQITPTLKQHSHFVKNNPYRAWYLLKTENAYVGAVYLLKNNSIGFSCLENKYWIIEQTIKFIQNKHKPLKEIKSLRPPYFYLNIPITNKKLIKYFDSSNARKIQMTFALANNVKLKFGRKN
jgi:hypothetical protein